MKKQLLAILISLNSIIAVAQNSLTFPSKNKFENKSFPRLTSSTFNNNESPPQASKPSNNLIQKKSPGNNSIFSPSDIIIGETDYDKQTNASSYPRIVKNADGTICAMWNSIPNGGMNNMAGTGYNYFDGSNWLVLPFIVIDSSPFFPSCVVTASYHEAGFGHAAGGMIITERPSKGVGAWSLDATSLKTNGNPNADTWARVVPGGSNNLSIHCIANDCTLGSDGGNILYSRSVDDGVTWNLLRTTIPGLDSIAYPYYTDGDSYCIASYGDTIAIVIGDLTTDIALFKSTDNGTTWTKTQITNQWTGGSYNSDGNISDINADGIADTVMTTGGDVNVVIDNTGICHVFWGNMRMCDNDSTPGVTTFNTFPATNGISYRNENMGAPVVITGAMDWNQNGQIDIATYPFPPGELGFGRYGNMGLSCVPGAACDANGYLHLVYMALNEMADTTIYFKSYYQIYATCSMDGGVTWTLPYNLITAGNDPDSSNFEGAYPSIAKLVDNNIYVEYQRDYIPGTYFGSPSGSIDNIANDPVNNVNYIVVASAPVCSTIGIESNSDTYLVSQNSPNPSNGATTINIYFLITADVKVEITTLTGQKLFTDVHKNMSPGTHTLKLNTAQLAPGIYFYTVTIGDKEITKKMVVMRI